MSVPSEEDISIEGKRAIDKFSKTKYKNSFVKCDFYTIEFLIACLLQVPQVTQ